MASARTQAPDDTIAELEEARQSLAAHIDAISDRVSPGNVARRQLKRARRLFQSDEGSINVRNAGIAAGVLGLLVVYAIRKSRI
jgi:hypothetical protein